MEKLILTIFGKAGYDALKALFSSNKSEIVKTFDSALERAKKWYVETYGNQYGEKNERFFDYQTAYEELKKLTFYLPDPDVDRISGIELKWGNKVPREVIIKFIGELKKEMAKESSLDAVFKEREILFTNNCIAVQTAKIAENTNELVELHKRQFSKSETKEPDLTALRNKYFKFLKEQYSYLSLKGFSERDLFAIPLNEIYINLSFSKTYTNDNEKERLLKRKNSLLKSLGEGEILHEITARDIIGSGYAVITGDPGSGKSTFLKQFTLKLVSDFEKESCEEKRCFLPIFFPVAAYADAYKKGGSINYPLRKFISDYFMGKNLPDLTPLFEDAWSNSHAQFLIDGLDEVSDETERRMMVGHVRNMMIADEPAKNRYIITCRTSSYTPESRFEPVNGQVFHHYYVSPFNMEQIRQFLFKWYCWYERDIKKCCDTFEIMAGKSLDRMMDIVENDNNIRDIATNPLMLTILALIEHEGGELPKTRAELYEKCLIMMSGRWDKLRSLHEKKHTGYSLGNRPITEDTIIELIGPVAWGMLEQGAPNISYKELKDKIAVILDKRNKDLTCSRSQADDFISIVKERTGILYENAIHSFAFMHQTFKEYLAARWLSDLCENRMKALEQKLFQPEWREVISLAAASLLRVDTGRFILEILAVPDAEERNILFAGECVVDIGREKVPDAVFDDLIKEIKNIAFDSSIPVRKAMAWRIRSWLDDNRNFEAFIPIPAGIYSLEKGKTSIKEFEISKYPVTNKWFRKFYDADGYEKPKEFWSKEGQRWLKHRKSKNPMFWHDRKWNCPNMPVVGVCWYEADAFCRWLTIIRRDGYIYALPTEDQWGGAAAGLDNRKYPWGAWKKDEVRCNTAESGIGSTSAVGIFKLGDTPEGISDMAGNVWEWTLSEYYSRKVRMDFLFDEEINILFEEYFKNPDKKTKKVLIKKLSEKNRQLSVLRGGSWDFDNGYARCAYRINDFPMYRSINIGFRCVRTLK